MVWVMEMKNIIIIIIIIIITMRVMTDEWSVTSGWCVFAWDTDLSIRLDGAARPARVATSAVFWAPGPHRNFQVTERSYRMVPPVISERWFRFTPWTSSLYLPWTIVVGVICTNLANELGHHLVVLQASSSRRRRAAECPDALSASRSSYADRWSGRGWRLRRPWGKDGKTMIFGQRKMVQRLFVAIKQKNMEERKNLQRLDGFTWAVSQSWPKVDWFCWCSRQ